MEDENRNGSPGDVSGKSIPNASKAAQLLTPIRADAEAIKEARERINEIIDQLQGRSLIFRGESKNYGKVSSSLYRHYCELRKGNNLDKQNFSAFEEMMLNIDEAKRNFPEGTSNLGILTELQHHGGKTAFIDFTQNIHIALYFACNGHPDEAGRLIIFDQSELKELDKRDIGQELDKRDIGQELDKRDIGQELEKGDIDQELEKNASDQEEIYWVNPVGSGIRVISQGSVFLCSKIGYLTAGKCEEKMIKKRLKAGILGFLDKFHGINEETIYNDLQGFIKRDCSKYADFYRGYFLQSKGKYKKAIQYYDRMLEIDPRFAEGYNARGFAKATLYRYGEAIEDYSRVLEINLEDASAYFNRGGAQFFLENYEKAIDDYDQALKFNAEYASAYILRGFSKIYLDRHEEAIEDFDQALRINPKCTLAYRSKGVSKAALGRYEEAIEDYSRELEIINPKDALAYSHRGAAKSNLGEYEKAIEDYNRALRINSEDAVAYSNRGLAQAALEEYEKAIEDYNRALRINSEDASAYFNRGNAQSFLKNYAKAIEDYDKALRINPEYAKAYYNRGAAKFNLGRHEEAIEDSKQALSLFQRQGNEERVRKAEELLRKIEGNLKNPPAGQ